MQYLLLGFGVVAIVASGFFSLAAIKIFGVKTPEPVPWQWRIYQYWFNFVGSITGWSSLYYLLFERLQIQEKIAEPTRPLNALESADFALLVVAIIGNYGPPSNDHRRHR